MSHIELIYSELFNTDHRQPRLHPLTDFDFHFNCFCSHQSLLCGMSFRPSLISCIRWLCSVLLLCPFIQQNHCSVKPLPLAESACCPSSPPSSLFFYIQSSPQTDSRKDLFKTHSVCVFSVLNSRLILTVKMQLYLSLIRFFLLCTMWSGGRKQMIGDP